VGGAGVGHPRENAAIPITSVNLLSYYRPVTLNHEYYLQVGLFLDPYLVSLQQMDPPFVKVALDAECHVGWRRVCHSGRLERYISPGKKMKTEKDYTYML